MNYLKILLAIAVLAGSVSCKDQAKDGAETQFAQDTTVRVKVKQCFTRDVEQLESLTGTVEAYVKNNISPKMALRIEKIYAEVGDHVRKGSKLAEMDAMNMVQAKMQMMNDSLEFSRTDQLYKAGGVSKSEWDARKLAYDISLTNYRNLLENTVLVSPIDGIVTARNYDKGDMYSNGAPLYVVEQIRPVKLMVNVSEKLFTNIRKGMGVDIKLDSYPDETFKGEVSLVYPTIDPQTRTFPVEVKIHNANEKARPGMFARATFSYGVANHVVVPDMAIVKLTGSGDRYVYVVESGKVVFKKVELGRRFDTEYEIISGLESGDNVVIEGQSRLTNGQTVTVVE